MLRFVTHFAFSLFVAAVALAGAQVLLADEADGDAKDAVAAGAAIENPEAASNAEVSELAGGGHTDAKEAAEQPGPTDNESHGDAHHAPHDLSHQNATSSLNDSLEVRSDLAIWTFVVFIFLLAVLGKFAWGPVMLGLEKREQSIAAMIDEAKRGQEQAAEQLKQYEAQLAAASEEARELVTQARKDAETAKDRILAEAQQAADRQRQRAVEDIQVAKNVALQEITKTSVDLAVNLAGRIVRQQLKAEDHSQLIREAMDQLPSRN
ncbi:MAG: F0F1 ATP synthase subunit B [Planctomycetota bacterium]|nr:F0F1 ATP synthase subunit B [Planctomycetota bacterium]